MKHRIAVDGLDKIDYHSDILGLEGVSSADLPDRLLTVQEVCELLKVSKAYIYTLTSQKKIPHIKMMGHLRFRKTEIDDWLKSQEVCSGDT